MQENVRLRDMGVPGISCQDERKLEVVATGLPVAGGIPLAVDATMVGVLHANGTPWPCADTDPGVALDRAHRSEDTT